MSTPRRFSMSRLWAIVVKEFIQMRRDRVTFGMMIGVPLIQLVLFGYAINADPKRLPTAVLLADYGPQGRTLLQAIRNSDYFEFTRELTTEQEGRDVLARGENIDRPDCARCHVDDGKPHRSVSHSREVGSAVPVGRKNQRPSVR